ncbi:MAG: hypothetical protein IT386_09840 [Deltaproteobacteria bacterium]|nr:hypothetical protein [Deltaproteobacteria bacterium]
MNTKTWTALLLAGALGGLGNTCAAPQQAAIVSPPDLSAIAADGDVAVQIELGTAVAPPGSIGVTLLSGIDFPPQAIAGLDARLAVTGTTANMQLSAADLSPGRNTLFVRIDRDGDGRPDVLMSSTFTWDAALKAAACKRKITPVVGVNHTDPIYMAGFGNDRRATGVHDDTWVRGVVLESRGKKIALFVLDVIGYFNNEIQTIRSLVDPALGFDSITVTSTHQHEGPDTMGLWGPDELTSGVDLGYLDFVNQSVADCISEANAALVPAEIKFVTGSTAGTSLPPHTDLVADGEVLQAMTIPFLIVDPENPFEPAPPGTGPIEVQGDPGEIINASVPAFQLRQREDGATIATLVNFASHPESLGSGNHLITSDFPHYMRERIESRYGGMAIYMAADLGVLQGPLDVDVAGPDGQPLPRRTFEIAQAFGEKLADRAALALDAETQWDAAPPIDTRSSGSISVLVQNGFFVIAGLQGVFGRRGFYTAPDSKRYVTSEVNALRIGNANIAVTPNELDPQIGDRYRARMTKAQHRFVAGLGNDEIGYQMPAEKFNPTCHQCWFYVAQGMEDACPLAATLDCGTVFQNNIGALADPQLEGEMTTLLDELNE